MSHNAFSVQRNTYTDKYGRKKKTFLIYVMWNKAREMASFAMQLLMAELCLRGPLYPRSRHMILIIRRGHSLCSDPGLTLLIHKLISHSEWRKKFKFCLRSWSAGCLKHLLCKNKKIYPYQWGEQLQLDTIYMVSVLLLWPNQLMIHRVFQMEKRAAMAEINSRSHLVETREETLDLTVNCFCM